jgi:hypothetical protein
MEVILDKSVVLYFQSVALRMLTVRFGLMPPEGVSPILSCSLRLNLIGTGLFLPRRYRGRCCSSRITGIDHHLFNYH